MKRYVVVIQAAQAKF